MPQFQPFPGLRYDTERAPIVLVTAPPYDVLSDDDRAELATRHPHNVVTIDLPLGGDDPYASAARTLTAWRSDGILLQDPPSFYGYRMTATDEAGRVQTTTGVFGALELTEPEAGGILPHEHTTPKAKTDRLDLTRATKANLSAVWGLSPAIGLTKLVEPQPDDVVLAWADDEHVKHAVWPIIEPERQKAITEAVASAPVVIADGHHRYAISLAYRDEVGAEGKLEGAGAVLTYVVELAEDELTVLPIHRLVGDLPAEFDLATALTSHFEVEAVDSEIVGANLVDRLEADGVLCLYTPSGAWLLTPKPNAFDGVRDLDTSRLDAALAGLPDHTLVYQHGVGNVRNRVDSGEFQAGIFLRSCPVEKILEIAHGGERMPPKTTFFFPKPRTGVVFRTFR